VEGDFDPSLNTSAEVASRKVQTNVAELTLTTDVEEIGRIEATRLSQLSESSIESVQHGGILKEKRCTKKGTNNHGRQIPPLVGVPKFCQLAASMKEAGRRRKEANKKKSLTDESEMEEGAAIDP
jgi:hypothetical protein